MPFNEAIFVIFFGGRAFQFAILRNSAPNFGHEHSSNIS